MLDKEENKKIIEKKISTVKFECDQKSHLIVDQEKCAKCNSDMIIKVGPYGQYLQCTNEECKNRQKIVVKTGVKCPSCGGDIVQKKSRYGKIFYACDNYPNCNFALWNIPTGDKCPKCGGSYFVKQIKNNEAIRNAPEYKYFCACNKCGYMWPYKE